MIDKQVFKFIVVGSVNTVVYYGLFSMFIYFNINYKISVLFATLIGVMFSFKSFGKFVFNNEDNSLIFRFVSVYIVLYLCNIFIIYISNIVVSNYYVAGFIATIVCAVLSFILNKKYVFKGELYG